MSTSNNQARAKKGVRPLFSPTLAVTSGEPAGIGPDILLLAAQREWPARLVAIGDFDVLAERAAALMLDTVLTRYTPEALPALPPTHQPGTLAVLHVAARAPVTAGQLDVRNAAYVLETLDTAIDGCRTGDFDAMVTCPVQKSVILDAGIAFSGHTEYLAAKTGTPRVVMLLTAGDLRVALATTHLALADVPAAINAPDLLATLRILHRDLRQRFVIENPRIAVLGLNPHAGEGGHLGREEIDIIIPVIEQLRSEGMLLLGPLPADTAFTPRSLAGVDAVLAMYHDQGLPTLKYAGFGEAVNITLGLPIVRTSVDHGTALDLAAGGHASEESLCHAIEMARCLCEAGAATDASVPPAP